MAPRFSLRTLFLGCTITAILCCGYVAFRWTTGPIASPVLLARLQPGMTASEVEQILGPPTERGDSSITYLRPFNPGWCSIVFDERGRMAYIDHEIPFP